MIFAVKGMFFLSVFLSTFVVGFVYLYLTSGAVPVVESHNDLVENVPQQQIEKVEKVLEKHYLVDSRSNNEKIFTYLGYGVACIAVLVLGSYCFSKGFNFPGAFDDVNRNIDIVNNNVIISHDNTIKAVKAAARAIVNIHAVDIAANESSTVPNFPSSTGSSNFDY